MMMRLPVYGVSNLTMEQRQQETARPRSRCEWRLTGGIILYHYRQPVHVTASGLARLHLVHVCWSPPGIQEGHWTLVMERLCKDILIVPSHGPLNNPSFPNCILSVFLQNNEVPTFIWTLEYHLRLWLSCCGDTFRSCMLSPFLIVSPAKFGPLEYKPLSCAQACVSVIHSHGHSAVGFVLSGLVIFTDIYILSQALL